MDNRITLDILKEHVKQFIEERDWKQFQTPKNNSMDIACEAAELMELFLWVESKDSWHECQQRRTEVEHELADIFFGLLKFSVFNDIDLSTALQEKMALMAEKYPVEKSRGRREKYDRL